MQSEVMHDAVFDPLRLSNLTIRKNEPKSVRSVKTGPTPQVWLRLAKWTVISALASFRNRSGFVLPWRGRHARHGALLNSSAESFTFGSSEPQTEAAHPEAKIGSLGRPANEKTNPNQFVW
jgi:hypothetical protein